jgi:hypothetical protein
MNDLRIPIGAFFTITGVMLMLFPNAKAPLTEAPVNLYAGICMLAFGGVMLWLAKRRHS